MPLPHILASKVCTLIIIQLIAYNSSAEQAHTDSLVLHKQLKLPHISISVYAPDDTKTYIWKVVMVLVILHLDMLQKLLKCSGDVNIYGLHNLSSTVSARSDVPETEFPDYVKLMHQDRDSKLEMEFKVI